MKFFLDTAVVDEIRPIAELGILDGVTTNPTLIHKSGKPFKETILAICDIVKGPVSVEVTSEDRAGMLKEAREFATWSPHVVVKVPLCREGIAAVATLTRENIRTNVTLCFSPAQALIAAKAGASYISPFIGRLDDIGHNGMELIAEIRQVYDNYGYPTEVLAASIRSPLHVREAALAGADVSTLPAKVFDQLLHHPLTDKGIAMFNADWAAATKQGQV
jgi:transaldolase